MHVRADGQALVTGGADKDVKFWEFEQQQAAASYMVGLGLFIRCNNSRISLERIDKVVNACSNAQNVG